MTWLKQCILFLEESPRNLIKEESAEELSGKTDIMPQQLKEVPILCVACFILTLTWYGPERSGILKSGHIVAIRN